MKTTESSTLQDELSDINIPLSGSLNLDRSIEDATGDPDKLMKTVFFEELEMLFIDKIRDGRCTQTSGCLYP
jgi:hypothetical protein